MPMACSGHQQIQMAVAGDENGLELESEQDVLRTICEHSDFAMVCISAPCAHIMSACANVLSQSKPALATDVNIIARTGRAMVVWKRRGRTRRLYFHDALPGQVHAFGGCGQVFARRNGWIVKCRLVVSEALRFA